VIDAVEKTLNVGIHHPVIALALQQLNPVYRLIDAAAFAIGKAAIFKLGVKQRLDDPRHRGLQDAVAHRRDGQKTHAAGRFFQRYAQQWLGLIGFVVDFIAQSLKVFVQPVGE